MRQDAEPFRSRNAAPVKYPRAVVKIEFDVESLYLTTHEGIDGIPGVVIENVLQEPSALSQKIVPDEARSEIGTLSFSLIDKDSVFTEAARIRLQDEGYGLRGKTVKLYIGYAEFVQAVAATAYGGGTYGGGTYGGVGNDGVDAIFADFVLFQTQVITGASYDEGVYKIDCADITREQREDICEPKVTNLSAALTASATTVEVYSTTDFQPIDHGTSYSDSPSATVGYIKVDKEIIKYTGKTAASFTGCTRGALNTKAVAHEFESTADQDRRPRVEEYIYVEEPCAKLAYKILTGRDPLTGVVCWPDHWNLGIDPDLVTVSDFTGLGDDMWNTADDTAGFVPVFLGLKKVTGKRFLESELYVLMGCYPTVYADGTLGLKRMNHVLADSASVVTLNENNCVSWGELRHEYGRLHNRIRIDWNWDGEKYTRTTLYIDPVSIQIHGPAPVKTYQFKGLHGSRHTDELIRKRINAIRDRYSQPPETTTVTVLPSLNILEVGDITRLQLPTVRDFAGTTDSIDRSFEIQQGSYNWANGTVNYTLFGSTARANELAVGSEEESLPAGFYTDRGTELSTVCTISVVGGVGIIQAGSYNLAGHADVNNDAAIYYYDGDLQLASGATLVISDNVQIRHNGFFQINGTIDGSGSGLDGASDSAGWNSTQEGQQGFIGNSRGMDGASVTGSIAGRNLVYAKTSPCALTQGKYSSFPYVDLTIDGNDILGIPSDLRGTSGGAGGKAGKADDREFNNGTVVSNGGTGGNGGSGLVLVGKGMAFGGAGLIDLSGDDSSSTSSVVLPQFGQIYPGAGGAGCPGGLLILLDGASVSLPDVGGHFTAACGTVPVNGTPMPQRGPALIGSLKIQGWADPGAGFPDPSYISGTNLSNSAYRIQYLPSVTLPQEDQGDKPAAPTSATISATLGKLTINATVDLIPGDRIEYYASSSNDRTTATRVGFGAQTEFVYSLATGGLKYLWMRVRRVLPGVDLFSDWYPSSPTGGLNATVPKAVYEDIEPGSATAMDQTFEAGPVTCHASGVPPKFSNFVDYLTVTPDHDCDLLVTCNFEAQATHAEGEWDSDYSMAVRIRDNATLGSSVNIPGDEILVSTTRGAHVARYIATVTGGIAYDCGLWSFTTASLSGLGIDYWNIKTTVEQIKL